MTSFFFKRTKGTKKNKAPLPKNPKRQAAKQQRRYDQRVQHPARPSSSLSLGVLVFIFAERIKKNRSF
jgi:hypothetical protein